MKYIGFCGEPGSGKSTAARELCHLITMRQPGFSCGRIRFTVSLESIATPAKSLFRDLFGYDSLSDKTPEKRAALAAIIDAARQLDPLIWMKSIEFRAAWSGRDIDLENHIVLIDDVLRADEAAWIHERGGKLVCVVRAENGADELSAARAIFDPLKPDDVLLNHGTRDGLRNALAVMFARELEALA